MFITVRRLCSVMPFYAVRVGRKPGVYNTWNECKAEVTGFPKAKYKKFDTKKDAEAFVGEDAGDAVVAGAAGIDDGNITVPELWNPQKESLHPYYAQSAASNILGVKKNVASFKAKGAAKKIKVIPLEDTMKHQFITRDNLPTSAVVYTDGCCLNNGKSNPVAGVGVFWAPHHPMNVSEHLDVASPSNQKAELRAASRALEIAIEMGLRSIELRTDSIYTIKSMTEWIKHWQANGWLTCGNKEVVNKKEMTRLAELCKKISITWVHVAGHQGIYGNEEADRLAREGALHRDS